MSTVNPESLGPCLSGSLEVVQSGKSVGQCGGGSSDVGKVVIPSDHRETKTVSGGE